MKGCTFLFLLWSLMYQACEKGPWFSVIFYLWCIVHLDKQFSKPFEEQLTYLKAIDTWGLFFLGELLPSWDGGVVTPSLSWNELHTQLIVYSKVVNQMLQLTTLDSYIYRPMGGGGEGGEKVTQLHLINRNTFSSYHQIHNPL